LRVLGVLNVGVGLQQPRATAHDDAPAFDEVVVVDLEDDRVIGHGREQFGALGGAKQHGAVLHDEVDGKDLGLAGEVGDQPAQRDAAQQVPVLVLGKHGYRLVATHVLNATEDRRR
jgi:hypothetical protein